MHRPICDFFHYRNTGIGRCKYLGTEMIIGGHRLFQNYYCPAPCSEAAPTHMRVCERVCVCVFLFPIISSNLPTTPTHTSAMRASGYGGASKEKCNRQCTLYMYNIISLRTQRKPRDVWSLQQNQQDSKNKHTRNWEHPPSLFGAAQNLSASRNIHLTYFQVCVIGMASSQIGKMCPVSRCRQTEDVSFMDSELLNCRKLLKIDVGKYGIPELGQLCKQISVFHEIDIESQKDNGYG